MIKFKQIDISGDAGLMVYGTSLEELFENAARGMFHLMTGTSAIKAPEDRSIELKVNAYEDTLVKWLNELLFLFDTYGFTGKTFNLCFKDDSFKAIVSGGTFDPEYSEKKLLIKAATYHNLSLRKVHSHWEATVIFDI